MCLFWQHFLSLVMTVSFVFLLLHVVHMSLFHRFLVVCSLSDTRALVQNLLEFLEIGVD